MQTLESTFETFEIQPRSERISRKILDHRIARESILDVSLKKRLTISRRKKKKIPSIEAIAILLYALSSTLDCDSKTPFDEDRERERERKRARDGNRARDR